MPKVTLLNNKFFTAYGDGNLLDEARKNGFLLEHSCRTGRCGVCKARVTSGTTTPVQVEESLSQEEVDQGYILTCCRTAETDVRLAVEDLGRLASIQTKTLPCRISELGLLTDDVIRIVLRVPPNNPLDYVAGQYIDVIGSGGARRSYSIANARRADDRLELHIRKVPDGLMSEYWFNKASLNDLLRMEGPLGTFSYRETSAKNIVFLATGTGIAPVKAILEELALEPELTVGKKLFIYWGGRTQSDIYREFDFDTIDVSFIPVLSRASPDWHGRVGYVQHCVLEDGLDLTSTDVYACGSEAMINAAKKLLIDNGLSQSQFYSDAFVSSN